MQPATTTFASGAVAPAAGGPGSEGPPGTVIYMPMMTSPSATNIYERYRHRQSLVLGVGQVLIGILCIVFNAVGLAFAYSEAFGALYIGPGFWSGILFVITGSIGISAGVKRARCQIIGFMVTCILSAICSGALLSLGVIGTVTSRPLTSCQYRYSGYGYGYSSCYDASDTESYRVIVAMQALLAILAFIEAVFALWGSAICCQAVCCCTPQPQTVMVPANYFTNDSQMVFMNQTQGMPYAYPQPPATNIYPQGQMLPPAYQTSFVPSHWNSPPQQMPLSAVSPSAPTLDRPHPPPYPAPAPANHSAEEAKY